MSAHHALSSGEYLRYSPNSPISVGGLKEGGIRLCVSLRRLRPAAIFHSGVGALVEGLAFPAGIDEGCDREEDGGKLASERSPRRGGRRLLSWSIMPLRSESLLSFARSSTALRSRLHHSHIPTWVSRSMDSLPITNGSGIVCN